MDIEKCINTYVKEIRNNFVKKFGGVKENITIKYSCNYDGEVKDNIELYYYNNDDSILNIEFNTYTYNVFFKEIVNLIKDISTQLYKNSNEAKEYFNKLIDTKYTKLANAQLLEKDFFKLNLVDYINLD